MLMKALISGLPKDIYIKQNGTGWRCGFELICSATRDSNYCKNQVLSKQAIDRALLTLLAKDQLYIFQDATWTNQNITILWT